MQTTAANWKTATTTITETKDILSMKRENKNGYQHSNIKQPQWKKKHREWQRGEKNTSTKCRDSHGNNIKTTIQRVHTTRSMYVTCVCVCVCVVIFLSSHTASIFFIHNFKMCCWADINFFLSLLTFRLSKSHCAHFLQCIINNIHKYRLYLLLLFWCMPVCSLYELGRVNKRSLCDETRIRSISEKRATIFVWIMWTRRTRSGLVKRKIWNWMGKIT